MAYLLALGSAALYGAADFLGGLASRQTNTIAIMVTSQGVGLAVLAFLLPLLPAATPSVRDLIWGGAAGLTGGIGVGLLYRALAVGRMAVVAPTTAVCAVMIPVAAGLFFGEQLAPLTMLGIALAIVAIVLVSQQEAAASVAARTGALPPGVGLALASGVAIGVLSCAGGNSRPGGHVAAAGRSRRLGHAVRCHGTGRRANVAHGGAGGHGRRRRGSHRPVCQRAVPVGYPVWAAWRRRDPVIAVPREYRDPRAVCAWRASQRLAGCWRGVRARRDRAYRQWFADLLAFERHTDQKVVIADQMARLVDPVFAAPEFYGAGALSLAVVAYAVQIYCSPAPC